MTPPPIQPHTAPETHVSGAVAVRERYAPDLALTGGRWIGDRGIMRWHPDPPPITDENAEQRGQIVCPCGARETETCRTSQGRRTKAHSARTKPQTCPCGAPLGWKRRLCDACNPRLRIKSAA